LAMREDELVTMGDLLRETVRGVLVMYATALAIGGCFCLAMHVNIKPVVVVLLFAIFPVPYIVGGWVVGRRTVRNHHLVAMLSALAWFAWTLWPEPSHYFESRYSWYPLLFQVLSIPLAPIFSCLARRKATGHQR